MLSVLWITENKSHLTQLLRLLTLLLARYKGRKISPIRRIQIATLSENYIQ